MTGNCLAKDVGVASAAPISVFEACNKINTEQETLRNNIKANMGLGLPLFWPEQIFGNSVYLIAGGPSAELYQGQRPLMVAGSAHKYAENKGFWPDFAVFLDARPENSEFVTHAIKGCKYLVASQCHPDFVKKLVDLGADVYLWHAQHNEDDEWFGDEPTIWGGSTTTLRCFNIGILLGFSDFHVYGFDSAYSADGVLHPYEHFDSLKNPMMVTSPNGRKFMCEQWMVKQSVDMLNLIEDFGHLFKVKVYGNGLIADMLTEKEVSNG